MTSLTSFTSITNAAFLLLQEVGKAAEEVIEQATETVGESSEVMNELPVLGEAITNYKIILIVAIVSFATAGILAAATYLIDKNATKRDV